MRFGRVPFNWKGQFSYASAHPFAPSIGHAATAIPCQRFSREKPRLPPLRLCPIAAHGDGNSRGHTRTTGAAPIKINDL